MRAAPKLPLEFGDGGMESYTDDEIKEIIKQNFKMVIMTNPGERIMIPEFGVGIRRYLFELRDSENTERLLSEIEEQARTYIPPINVLDIEVADEDPNNPNLLALTISYEIDFLNARDRLDLLVEY
jgi:phage baseplate assembly protein W